MPSVHRHKLRQVRLPDPLWDAFKLDCAEAGTSPTAVIGEMIAARLGISSADLETMLNHHDGADLDPATGQARDYTKRR